MSANRLALLVLTALPLTIGNAGKLLSQGLQPPIYSSPVSTESGVVTEAGVVLQELSKVGDQQIPARILAEAYGIAIVPHYMRGAFVIGVSGGRGVLMTRDPNGNWRAPEFITIGGGSFGWQAGVQAVDLVLIFRTPQSLQNIRQGKLTLGVDASAAAGPVGRYTSAATDARLQAEILTYSRSRGLFAGVSLGGSGLKLDVPATQQFYQMTPSGGGVVPPSAAALVDELTRFANPPTKPIVAPAGPDFGTGLPTVNPQPGQAPSAMRVQALSNAVGALQSRVDDQWKAYLGPPAEWLAGRQPTDAEVHSMLIRYERVETNAQFAALRGLPEFQLAMKELRTLAEEINRTSGQVKLPPPPKVGGF